MHIIRLFEFAGEMANVVSYYADYKDLKICNFRQLLDKLIMVCPTFMTQLPNCVLQCLQANLNILIQQTEHENSLI